MIRVRLSWLQCAVLAAAPRGFGMGFGPIRFTVFKAYEVIT